MTVLRTRRRLLAAVGLGLALVAGATGGAIAATTVYSARAEKATKAVFDAAGGQTTSSNWTDVANMTLTFKVPSGESDMFVMTYSADSICGSFASSRNRCVVRLLMNGGDTAPGEVSWDLSPAAGSDEGVHSMQFLASPMPSGTYSFQVQFKSTDVGWFQQQSEMLTVARSIV